MSGLDIGEVRKGLEKDELDLGRAERDLSVLEATSSRGEPFLALIVARRNVEMLKRAIASKRALIAMTPEVLAERDNGFGTRVTYIWREDMCSVFAYGRDVPEGNRPRTTIYRHNASRRPSYSAHELNRLPNWQLVAQDAEVPNLLRRIGWKP